MKFKVLLVIPSRFASTRLPGKPLKKIGDKTLIQRVYERAKKAYAVIQTGERRFYGCFAFRKGVIGPEEN